VNPKTTAQLEGLGLFQNPTSSSGTEEYRKQEKLPLGITDILIGVLLIKGFHNTK
jgi:hypothetical protein